MELADVCCIGMEICEKVKKKPENEEDWVIDADVLQPAYFGDAEEVDDNWVYGSEDDEGDEKDSED